MKKTISLLLVLVLCLSLCACGGGNDVPETTEAEESPVVEATVEEVPAAEEMENNEPQLFHLNETLQVGDYEITVHDVRAAKNISINFSTGGKQFGAKNDYFICVSYSLKNIGKHDIQANQGIFTLNYADGYQFLCDDLLYLHGMYRDLYKNGGTQEPFETLETLGDEVYFLEAFDVPAQVVEDKESPLFLTLNAPMLYVDEANGYYNIRPIDEIQQQALYQQANELWAAQDYTQAVSRLDEVGDYKDAVALRERIFQEYCLRVGTYYDDAKAYIESVADTLSSVSGAALEEAIVGEWYVSLEGEFPMTFNADGSITDPNGKFASWSVSDDILTIETASGTLFTATVKQLSDFGFFLFHTNSRVFDDGTFYKGMCAVH